MPQALPRTLAIASLAMLAATGTSLNAAAAADQPQAAQASAASPGGLSRVVKVDLNKSLVVDLPRDARDVLVSNPDIADAVIRTPTRIYITGIAVGQANIIVFDRAGAQIVSLQLSVERDTAGLSAMLRSLLPDADISIQMVNDNIVLSGSVKNAGDSQKAQDIAGIYLGSPASAASGASATPAATSVASSAPGTPTVVNMLTIQGEDQVMVKVHVAEVDRTLLKQLGIDWNAQNINIAGLLLGAATSLPFAVNGAAPANSLGATYLQNYPTQDEGTSSTAAPTIAQRQLGVTIRALEQTQLLKVLAEPTLTAISGESASFLAGGQFPFPGPPDQNGQPTVQFKDFGVALSMTPVVLSDGRINLHVKTEVSDLSAQSFNGIPGLNDRRAETTLELPSGGSMVLGGLLQDSDNQAVAKLPGLGSLPILGTLFRSRDFQRKETELVIIVTPYLVKPVPPTALASPDQGLSLPADSQTLLFGNLNRLYGGSSATPAAGQKYQGHVGYIYQ